MSNSNSNQLNILDLSDEILFNILKKLKMVDVFYSLADVNQRFDRLVFDPVYIHDLDMTDIRIIKSVYDRTFSIDMQVLSKICDKILPRIHGQVYKLTIEQYSMKQILQAIDYPHLYSLTLVNFPGKKLHQYLTDNLILCDLLAKQITHLKIDIKTKAPRWSKTVSKIFDLILSLCKKLTVLDFCDMFRKRKCWTSISYRPSGYISSTLIKLKINVASLYDFLFLLDGRLDSLTTLIINVSDIYETPIDIHHAKQVSKLKFFSFTSLNRTFEYDNLIVPLLCRMTNLEELNLSLSVVRLDSTFIDGIQLYDQFLIYMTKLKKFTFRIDTHVINMEGRDELPSNEEIQRSFLRRGYQEVVSCVHIIPKKTGGSCHIYSLPYEFKHFINLNNSFQGGMFDKVLSLTMKDHISFEHDLFQLISQNFPFLEFLSVLNGHPQQDKHHSSTLITLSYLTRLNLMCAHVDYAEQFLLEKNAYLPRLSNLCIDFISLTEITNSFSKDPKHFNFTTLKTLIGCERFANQENFHRYFPLL